MKEELIKEARSIMHGITALTATIHTLSTFVIFSLLLIACLENSVLSLVIAIAIFLINIPIWKLGDRAYKLRDLTK